MIGRFPWDPFPAGEPEPKGPDPLHASLYRAAVAGSDAYRAVRSVLRRERGVLRVGNRFVPDGRYRQVGFVAFGHAAASMALAALDALGDRLTQGFVAGPEAPPPYLPFRSTVVADGWGPDGSATGVLDATREIALGLKENDLLLVLVSPGASRCLLTPPDGFTAAEFAHALERAWTEGATGPELGTLVRVLGRGGVGGRLLPDGIHADVQTLLVDRGEGPTLSGGGPTVPVVDAERERALEVIRRFGWGGPAEVPPISSAPLASRVAQGPARRPVVVAGPSDALRSAADLAFEKGWTIRIAELAIDGRSEAVADRLLGRVEEILPEARRTTGDRSKGLVALAMTRLDVPDGVSEEGACRSFVARASGNLRRRELSVSLLRTAGPIGPAPPGTDARPFAGAVVGATTDPDATVPPGAARALRMRAGITDVGMLGVAVVAEGGRSAGRAR